MLCDRLIVPPLVSIWPICGLEMCVVGVADRTQPAVPVAQQRGLLVFYRFVSAWN